MFLGANRERGEDVGEEDDPIGVVAPPRLQRNFRRYFRNFGPLSKGWVLNVVTEERMEERMEGWLPRIVEACFLYSQSTLRLPITGGYADRICGSTPSKPDYTNIGDDRNIDPGVSKCLQADLRLKYGFLWRG